MSAVRLAVGAFGKLPFHGEFLRLGGEPAPVAAIERWWLAGAVDGQRSAGRAAAFAAAGPVFALLPEQGMFWALALFPSQDAVGRHYPFAVFAGVPASDFGDEPGLAPALFVPFFHGVYRAAAAGWAATPPALREQVSALAGEVDVGVQERRLLADLAAASADDLWSGLLGSAGDRRRLHVVDELRRQCADRAAVGVRIAPMPHQLHCCFWLMLLRRLRPDAHGLPLVVLHPGLAGRQPAATAFWTLPPPARAFATLWPACAPPGDAAAGAAPADLLAAAAAGGASGADLRDLLDQPDLTLRSLLHDLAARARQGARGGR